MEHIILSVDRDSVCMGDDCESHKYRVEIIEDITLEKFATFHLRLPLITFGHATWILKIIKGNTDICFLAAIAQQWKTPKLLINNILLNEILNKYKSNEFHAEYLCQTNPQKAYKRLVDDPHNIEIVRADKYKNYGLFYRLKCFAITQFYLK